MTTQTLTLADFLLARIAEDEYLANLADDVTDKIEDDWQDVTQPITHAKTQTRPPEKWSEKYGHAYQHIARHAPARVLAECAAKRAIVERFDTSDDIVLYPVVAALASVYADHPDYRSEWAS